MTPSEFSVRRTFRGASIYSLGEVITKASGFFLLPIFTRVLSPRDFGVFGYLQVLLNVGLVICGLGLYGAQKRYFYENSADATRVGEFSFTINVTNLLVVVAGVLPLTLVALFREVSLGASGIPYFPFVFVTLLTLIVNVLLKNMIALWQAQQRFSRIAFIQVSRFLAVSGVSLLLVLPFGLGVRGRIYGLFVGNLIFFAVFYWSYARDFVPRFSKQALRYAAGFGLPLVVHQLAGQIHNAIDRIILERYVSLDELGIYTLAFTVGHALNMFIMAFNQAYQPSYFQLMSSDREDKERQVVKTFKAWLVLVTAIASIGILFGGPFLRVFAGPRFVATIEVFPWIILAVFVGGFSYFFSAPIFYFKKTKVLPFKTGASAAVNIALNLWLIPVWGIVGAAVATVISHVVSSILSLIIGNRLYRMGWPYGWIAISIGVVSGAVVAVQYLGW